jgi:transcriptional regulator with GAF, ATPase, and Fis domain
MHKDLNELFQQSGRAVGSFGLRTLKEANWILGGPEGAAFKLGMKRTTLQSKMRKLGIARPS